MQRIRINYNWITKNKKTEQFDWEQNQFRNFKFWINRSHLGMSIRYSFQGGTIIQIIVVILLWIVKEIYLNNSETFSKGLIYRSDGQSRNGFSKSTKWSDNQKRRIWSSAITAREIKDIFWEYKNQEKSPETNDTIC